MSQRSPELFLLTLFEQLRRRRFALAPDDFEALRQALRAGFGWSSRAALCELCCALWAKSCEEREVVAALFQQLPIPTLELPAATTAGPTPSAVARPSTEDHGPAQPAGEGRTIEVSPQEVGTGSLPSITLGAPSRTPRRFVFAPQYPLGYRDAVQAWRRLRRSVRFGPRTELDVHATAELRCRAGVATPPVLRPRRRNAARLLLMVDRQGSMTPFHSFVETVCEALQKSGNLAETTLVYFHDVPATGADGSILADLPKTLFSPLDPVLPRVAPLRDGFVYASPDLSEPMSLRQVLRSHAAGAAALISDAGAARGHYDTPRLLDTVAFLKGLREHTARFVWLNPLPTRRWKGTTAEQIARHVPMFPLDRKGLHGAVTALRGAPSHVERAV